MACLEIWTWSCRVARAQLIGNGILVIQQSDRWEKLREACGVIAHFSLNDGMSRQRTGADEIVQWWSGERERKGLNSPRGWGKIKEKKKRKEERIKNFEILDKDKIGHVSIHNWPISNLKIR